MVAPRIASRQPTFPKNVSFSCCVKEGQLVILGASGERTLRKMDDKTAQITTERAPSGVTRIASVKA